METEVVLQPIMTFSVIDIVVAAVLAVVTVSLIIYAARRPKKAPAPVVSFTPLPDARTVALSKLASVEKQLSAGEIDTRECCEKTSEIIRSFASAALRKDLSSATLADIAALNISDLSDTVALCYTGEFPRVPDERAREALSKSKELIGRWQA